MRSATQPLGSPQPLSRARLTSRLDEVNTGFRQLSRGADQLSKGLTEGAAKLRAAIWLEEATGISLAGGKPAEGLLPKSDPSVNRAGAPSRGQALATGLKQASAGLQWSQGMPSSWNLTALQGAFEALSQESASGANAKPGASMPAKAKANASGPRPAPTRAIPRALLHRRRQRGCYGPNRRRQRGLWSGSRNKGDGGFAVHKGQRTIC